VRNCRRRCATRSTLRYKDLEKGKWVTIVKWLDVQGAEKLVLEAIARAEKKEKGRAAVRPEREPRAAARKRAGRNDEG
jgi:hypothetical protein